jgi:hypothetical protein
MATRLAVGVWCSEWTGARRAACLRLGWHSLRIGMVCMSEVIDPVLNEFVIPYKLIRFRKKN